MLYLILIVLFSQLITHFVCLYKAFERENANKTFLNILVYLQGFFYMAEFIAICCIIIRILNIL